MPRLIDAGALIAEMHNVILEDGDDRSTFYEVIERQPTIAQPEIIHCRECKYWMPYDWMFSEVWKSKNMEDYPENEIGCMYADMSMSATDFCSRAERREESNESKERS